MPDETEAEAIARIRAAQAERKAAQQARGAEGRKRQVRAETDLQRSARARKTRQTEAAKRAAAEKVVSDTARAEREAIQQKDVGGVRGAAKDLSNRQQVLDRLIEGQTTDSNNN